MSKAANAAAASALKRADKKSSGAGQISAAAAAKKARCLLTNVDPVPPPATPVEAPSAADTDAASGAALEAAAEGASSKGSGAFLQAAGAWKRAEKKSIVAGQISAAAAAKKARCLLTNVDPVPPPATSVEAPSAADTDSTVATPSIFVAEAEYRSNLAVEKSQQAAKVDTVNAAALAARQASSAAGVRAASVLSAASHAAAEAGAKTPEIAETCHDR